VRANNYACRYDIYYYAFLPTGDLPYLRNLQLVSNAYTDCVSPAVDYRVWKACRKANPRLRVHLVTEGKHNREITFQTSAPVKSIVYDTPYSRVSAT
jgi:hypothetical protein